MIKLTSGETPAANFIGSTVKGLVNQRVFGIISVTEFGAVGDNSTDDTTAINNAIAACSTGSILIFPKVAVGYKITSGITIPVGIDVIMESPVIYFGTSNIAILTVGAVGSYNNGVELKLRAKKNTQSNWSSESDIAILLYNCNHSKIDIVEAIGSTIGVQCMGDEAGFAYNNCTLRYIVNNKYALDISNNKSLGTRQGWCNENYFIGGRFACNTGVNAGVDRYGIRFNSVNGVYYNENNIFEKPSFELNLTVANPGEAVPVLINYGMLNRIKSARDEGNSTVLVRTANNSTSNVVDFGRGDDLTTQLDEQSAYPNNAVKHGKYDYLNGFPIYQSGALHKKARTYDGSNVNVPGMMIVESSGLFYQYNTNLSITSTYLQVTGRMLGVYIDTSICKSFVIRKDCEAGYGGRINIQPYDANGNVLTDSMENKPYVRGASGVSPTWYASYGGYYGNGSDLNADYYFKVHADVKKILVMLGPGTAALRIRSFSVHVADNIGTATQRHATVWDGLEEGIPGLPQSPSIPTVGSHRLGAIFLNTAPAAGGTVGWICTTSGTFGTLSGVIGTITSGTRLLTVNDVTNLAVGQYITIVGVTGIKKILFIDPATKVVTLDLNANASVTDAAVAYNTPVFKTWGVISS